MAHLSFGPTRAPSAAIREPIALPRDSRRHPLLWRASFGLPDAVLLVREERIANGDQRLSFEERYADHAAYVSAVARAAEALRADRLLLYEDVAAYVAAAQAAQVP